MRRRRKSSIPRRDRPETRLHAYVLDDGAMRSTQCSLDPQHCRGSESIHSKRGQIWQRCIGLAFASLPSEPAETVSFEASRRFVMPVVSMPVNGKAVSADVDPRTLLVQFLRENLRLT